MGLYIRGVTQASGPRVPSMKPVQELCPRASGEVSAASCSESENLTALSHGTEETSQSQRVEMLFCSLEEQGEECGGGTRTSGSEPQAGLCAVKPCCLAYVMMRVPPAHPPTSHECWGLVHSGAGSG